MGILKREGLFQEYFSPEARFYPNDLKAERKNRVSFYLPNRETYNSLGIQHQTDSVRPPLREPLRDLLDPKWKGKMAIWDQHVHRRALDR